MLVELYWNIEGIEEHNWFEINESDKTKVLNLVKLYIKKNLEDYNVDALMVFLKERGYKVKLTGLSADLSICF